MSIEAIQQVTQIEQLMQEKKQAAEAEAKQRISEAERAGEQLLKQVRQDAQEQNKAAMAQAEKNATSKTQKVFSETAEACDVLCKAAESRLETAAALIVKRIVSVSWPL